MVLMFQVFIKQLLEEESAGITFQVHKFYNYFFPFFLSFHFKSNLDEFYHIKINFIFLSAWFQLKDIFMD